MWFAKDGPRPDSQRGPGIPLTSEEAEAIAGPRELKYVGTEAPSINVDKPSQYERNVVFEITSKKDSSTRMPEVGYYFVLGLEPSVAQAALQAKRDKA
jgi:hypothetical protein